MKEYHKQPIIFMSKISTNLVVQLKRVCVPIRDKLIFILVSKK